MVRYCWLFPLCFKSQVFIVFKRFNSRIVTCLARPNCMVQSAASGKIAAFAINSSSGCRSQWIQSCQTRSQWDAGEALLSKPLNTSGNQTHACSAELREAASASAWSTKSNQVICSHRPCFVMLIFYY